MLVHLAVALLAGGVKGGAASKMHSGPLFSKPLHFTPSPSMEHLRQNNSDSDLASLDGLLDPEHQPLIVNPRRPLLPR